LGGGLVIEMGEISFCLKIKYYLVFHFKSKFLNPFLVLGLYKWLKAEEFQFNRVLILPKNPGVKSNQQL